MGSWTNALRLLAFQASTRASPSIASQLESICACIAGQQFPQIATMVQRVLSRVHRWAFRLKGDTADFLSAAPLSFYIPSCISRGAMDCALLAVSRTISRRWPLEKAL